MLGEYNTKETPYIVRYTKHVYSETENARNASVRCEHYQQILRPNKNQKVMDQNRRQNSQYIGEYANGPHVRIKANGFVVSDLWRGKLCRRCRYFDHLVRVELCRQTEVDQFDVATFLLDAHHVLRLHAKRQQYKALLKTTNLRVRVPLRNYSLTHSLTHSPTPS